MKALLYATLISLTLATTGCSWFSDKDAEDETAGYTEKDFYDRIQESLDASNWDLAIQNLQLLESSFPFGRYAEQAQLELIFAYYRSGDEEAAIAAADRFIRLHPQHPNVDYAYYMKGLAQYRQSAGMLDSYLPTDATKRDTASARNTFATLNEMLARFPDSPYAADAHKRLVFLRNQFARSEIHAANYYFKRNAYLAAYNRGRYVVENFQKSPAVPDALAVMAQALHMMGEYEQAEEAATVLASNFPDYPALDNGKFDYEYYLSQGGFSWMNLLTLGIYGRTKAPEFNTRDKYNAIYQDSDD